MRSRCARYRWLQGLTITCRQTGCWNSAVRSYCRHRVRRRARHPPRRRPRPGSARRGGRAPGRPAHPARGDDPPGSENSCSVTYALNAEASSESQLEFDTVDVNRVLAAMDEARQPGESRDPRCLPGQPLCAELPLRRLARAGADGGGQGHLHRLRDGSRFGGLGGGLAAKRAGRTTVARVPRAVMRTEPGIPQA